MCECKDSKILREFHNMLFQLTWDKRQRGHDLGKIVSMQPEARKAQLEANVYSRLANHLSRLRQDRPPAGLGLVTRLLTFITTRWAA